MITAKSYREWQWDGEPWKDTSTNRWYVNVINPKTGAIKKVRAYKETDKAVREKKPKEEQGFSQQRKVLGFGEPGYIYIFKGINDNNEHWFKKSDARYCRLWGWYFPSDIPIPEDMPKTVHKIKLEWPAVGNSHGALYDDEKVKQGIELIMRD